MAATNVVIQYLPRSAFGAFHARQERWAVLVVHRRAGKTVAAINDLIKRAVECQKQAPRFAYVAPTYAQAKDVAWNYLKRFTEPFPGRVVSEAELHVTLPGDRRIRLYGSDNYDRMRGIYLDGVVIDEPADMDPAAWYDVIRPALSDRRGWCAWIGTPKGKDAFFRIYEAACKDPEWYTMLLAASQSGLLPADELESAKKSMATHTGAYEREYECSFEAPIAGSIYGDILSKMRVAGQIADFLYDHSFPVFACWDIGWSDETSIWLFQCVGRDVHWIWHTRQKHKNASEMMGLLFKSEITVHGHFLPWDSRATSAAVGVSYKGEVEKAGAVNVQVMPPTKEVWASIGAAREILARSYIHSTKCSLGLESLSAYHTKEVKNGGAVSREPVHDWSSHDADSFLYGCEAIALGMVKTVQGKRMFEMPPRLPDGTVVDLDLVRSKARRSGTAMAGHSPL